MYSSFYNLSGVPFQLTPDPSFFFASRTHENALSYLAYGLSQGEGIIALTGDEGTGRSTLLAHFMTTLDLERYVPVSLVGSHLKADTVLRNIAARLDIGVQTLPQNQQLSAIQSFLDELQEYGRRLLIVVDEADDLQIDFFDALRSVSDYVTNGVSPVQLILLGGAKLRRRLNGDEALKAIRQRLIASCSLAPLTDVAETEAYIVHRLRQVGWNDDPVMTPEAVEAIHHFCGGIPRRINQLCSRLMLHGSLESLHQIDEATVSQVIAELVVDKDALNGGDEPMTAPAESPRAEVVDASPPAAETAVAEGQAAPTAVAFDRRSVIETDLSQEAEQQAPPTVTVTVEREDERDEPLVVSAEETPEPAPVAEPPEPRHPPVSETSQADPIPEAIAVSPSADQQLIDMIVSEFARLDPAIPRLAATALFGDQDGPEGPETLATGGEAKRLGLGPVTASMIYRAAIRELSVLDANMVRRALTGVATAGDVGGDDRVDGIDEISHRMDVLEDRIKTSEKLLSKAVKALKKRRK